MKKITLILATLLISLNLSAQKSKAKKLLDEVSNKMGAYENMSIGFSTKLVNRAAKIDEAPTRGSIIIAGEKYNLDHYGLKFIFDGKKLATINNEEEEVTITKGNMNNDDGIVSPSKLISFYKDGYNYTTGKLRTIAGRKIQFIELTPMDSNSKIKRISLGIDAKTKHIYQLLQIGVDGVETTLTIHKFKSNQAISKNLFKIDKSKYKKLGYLID